MSQFDDKAATWDQDPRRIKMAKEIAEAMARKVKLNTQMSAMEFGCGTGLVTMYLADKVKSITAVDNSAGMLAVLEQKIKAQLVHNVEIKHVDLTIEQTLGRSFDLIYSVLALHHIKDCQSLLAYFKTILNPGGIIAIADLDDEDGTFHLDGSHVDYTSFGANIVKSVLSNTGFEKITYTTVFKIPKPRENGIRDYPVFLITGQKPYLEGNSRL